MQQIQYKRNGVMWRIMRHFINLPYMLSMITTGIVIIWLPIRVTTEVIKGTGQWKSALAIGSIVVAIIAIIFLFMQLLNRLAFEPLDMQSN
jgi:hypothetical protein